MTASNVASLSKVTLLYLASDHLITFEDVLSSILTTDLAQLTYSQIIDGLLVRDVWNAYENRRCDIEVHLEPCPESIEMWKTFQTSLQPRNFEFNAVTVQGYQDTAVGTKEFTLRLMELVAVACHDIAVLLYKLAEGGVGKHAEKPPARIILDNYGVPYPEIPTDFYHTEYLDWEQYPQGVAEMAGYWAEFELFGGVVVFDRGESSVEYKNAFIHPGGSYKIFQLSDAQLQAYAEFGAQKSKLKTPGSSPPFPFKTERWARRVHEDESMSLHIYRDTYERKPKIETSDRAQCLRVRLEDEPHLLDIIDLTNANGGKLPSDFPQGQDFGSTSSFGQ